jgi:XTP/dITP diphosphohydrolase
VLTVLLTSSRVAPGLLSWQAWAALREAFSVLASAPASDLAGDHPQAAALADAGIEVSPGSLEDAAGIAASGKRAVWLAPPDSPSSPAAFPAGARVLQGSADLPGAHLIDAVAVMDTLRVSCPWDQKQTHASLLKYLLEEAYEAAEAIELGDSAAMREELGDVLFQAVFHARVASERSAADGGFTIDDIADELVAKLKRRHPHVFGSVAVADADEVNRNWEEIKKAEKAARAEAAGSGPASVLDGVPFGQPALSLASQLLRRAARAGYSLESAGSPEASGPGSLGAELMALVSRARDAGADPELELRETARRFADQVRAWENTRG